MSTTLTILGCGSSGGVPRIGNDWGLCDPANPKNRRRRCSVLVTKTGPNGQTRVLIDTSPDLREQMLANGIADIDGVMITHEHADHTHGIDDLRAFFLMKRRRVSVWADELTGHMLTTRFSLLLLHGTRQRLSADHRSPSHQCRNASHHRRCGRRHRKPAVPGASRQYRCAGISHRQHRLYARPEWRAG